MFEIVGYEKINFTNTETGELISGVKLHLIGDEFTSVDGSSSGRSVLSKFFSNKHIRGELKVGAFCEFNIRIDSKGQPKIIGVSIS